MTLECGTTVIPASHAGKFRDISGVFRPRVAILPQKEKTKLLSTALPTLRAPAEDRQPHPRSHHHRENPTPPQALGPARARAARSRADHTAL
jgi:hypothetical protein